MLCLCRFANLHTNSIECSHFGRIDSIVRCGSDQSVVGQKQEHKERKNKKSQAKFTLSALTNETRLE